MSSRLARVRATPPVAVAAIVVLAALVAGAAALPEGVPAGVVALGLTRGGLVALTAMGLVLVFRATGAVNFAQAEIGGLAAAAAVLVVTGWELPYLVGVAVGVVVAAVSGLVVERTVVARLRGRSPLLLTVATIGLAQVFGGLQVAAPSLFDDDLAPFSRFALPWDLSIDIGPITLGADHLLAAAGVVAIVVALQAYLGRSDFGVAARGIAGNAERAVLLGIPVARVSAVTWVVAATLSGVSSVLATPIQGISLGAVGGPSSLLPALAAAVLGGMVSLPRTALAALALGVFSEVVFWSYPRSAVVDVAFFAVVACGLLLQRQRTSRDGMSATSDFVAAVQSLPARARSLPLVRAVRVAVCALIAAAAVWAAVVADPSDRGLVTNMVIFAIVALSLVVLTGWSGQVSLGQFAFAGLGAGVTAGLLDTVGLDLFVSLAGGMVVGAVASCVVGIPALRMQGLLLAVVTLAFAVPVSSYALSARYAPVLTPSNIPRPELFGAVDLAESWYFLGLVVVVFAGVTAVVRNLDRSRVGRAIRAVRDNERAAAGYGIDARAARLLAYGLAGAIAGLGGGLYAVSLRGVGFGAFNANQSVAALTMVVVGGLGSIPGAVAGAVYIQGTQYWLTGAAQFLASGVGVLALVLLLPRGIGPSVTEVFHRAVARHARSRGVEIAGFTDRAGGADETASAAGVVVGQAATAAGGDGLVVEGLDGWYGSVQVLDGVHFDVAAGSVFALLGTNGAGKSTILRALAGVGPRAVGSVRYRDEEIAGLSPAARVARGISLVSGGHAVFADLTVAENLRLAGWVHRSSPAERRQAVDAAIAHFPALAERSGTVAGLLSGGEQHMLGLAMALVTRPSLLLVDELSLGLAPAVVSRLLEIVADLADDGLTIVLVEQSLETAARAASRGAFLERGRVRFVGPPADLLDRPDLARSVFFDADAAPARRSRRARAASRAVFEVRDVRVDIGARRVVDDVSFRLHDREIVGLIGANGAGKTTLLDVCSGFRVPAGGHVHLLGHEVTAIPPARRAQQGLGRVFQDARLFPSMTVRDALAVSLDRWLDVREPIALGLRVRAARRTERAVSRRVDELLEIGGLEQYADVPVSQLSTGTRRLVELVAVVGFRPRVLLLDEPTAGVAQREAEAVASTIEQFRSELGMSLVIVEHDIPMIAGLADRLLCLEQGRVLSEGPPSEVLHDPRVLESYVGSSPAGRHGSAGEPALASPPVG